VVFFFKYVQFYAGCGNVIYHEHSGTITSPLYPSNYPKNQNCIWQVIADPAYHLQVQFDDNFNIEYNEECRFDYISVRNYILVACRHESVAFYVTGDD